MYEDLLLRKQEIEDDLKSGDDGGRAKDRRELLMEQLQAVQRALGEEVGQQDDLVAYWDEQLDRGEMPDLDMTVEDLEAIRRRRR